MGMSSDVDRGVDANRNRRELALLGTAQEQIVVPACCLKNPAHNVCPDPGRELERFLLPWWNRGQAQLLTRMGVGHAGPRNPSAFLRVHQKYAQCPHLGCFFELVGPPAVKGGRTAVEDRRIAESGII